MSLFLAWPDSHRGDITRRGGRHHFLSMSSSEGCTCHMLSGVFPCGLACELPKLIGKQPCCVLYCIASVNLVLSDGEVGPMWTHSTVVFSTAQCVVCCQECQGELALLALMAYPTWPWCRVSGPRLASRQRTQRAQREWHDVTQPCALVCDDPRSPLSGIVLPPSHAPRVTRAVCQCYSHHRSCTYTHTHSLTDTRLRPPKESHSHIHVNIHTSTQKTLSRSLS